MTYPLLKEQMKEFPIYWLFNNRLIQIHHIKTPDDYSHRYYELHHFIKEQQFYRYFERFDGLQKLILMPKKMHADLHSGMSDERFFEKWNIDRTKLLYRNRII